MQKKKGRLIYLCVQYIFNIAVISQRPELQPMAPNITDRESPGPGNCLSVSRGRVHCIILRKCICKDTEVLSRSETFDP